MRRLRFGLVGLLIGSAYACGGGARPYTPPGDAGDVGTGGSAGTSGGSGGVGGTTEETGGSGGVGGTAAGTGGSSGAAGSPSDAGPGGSDAADTGVPFTPAQLPNLALWLVGDKGVSVASNKVTTWADQSGQNNHATQTVGDRQPTQVVNALNGHTVVRFDGLRNSLHVGEAPSLQWGTGDFTIEMVVSYTNQLSGTTDSPYGLLLSKQSQTGPEYTGVGFWANYPIPAIDSVLALQLQATNSQHVKSTMNGLNNGAPRILGGRRFGGTNVQVRINGALAGEGVLNTINIDTSGTFLFIGGQEKPTGVIQALKGDIAEIVAVGGPLTTLQLTQLETYLKTKYGL
jgi:hypothetical protein